MRPHPEHRWLRLALVTAAFVGGLVGVALIAWALL